MKRNAVLCTFLCASMAAVAAAHAQSVGTKGMDMKGMDMKDMPMKADAKAAKEHKGSGTVKSVDAAKGTVSLAHGPIQSMNWSAMTMTFKAKDKKMLDKIKPGAKVEFSFVQSGRDYVLTDIK